MKLDDLFEDAASNMNLINFLTDIFMDFYEDEKRFIDEDKETMIDNPFALKMDMIEKYTDNEETLDAIKTLKFYYDPKGYDFNDSGAQIKAAATYMPRGNYITFYQKNHIVPSIVAHELRHMVQFAEYEYERFRSGKGKKYDYRDTPIEIDAYWTDSFINLIRGYNDYEKKNIPQMTRIIMQDFQKSIPNLSPKKTKHYSQKTANALYNYMSLRHKGYEMSVEDLKKNADILDKREELIKLLDKNDYKGYEKLHATKQLSLGIIPGFKPEEEIVFDYIAPPSTLLPRDMSKLNISMATLYMIMSNHMDKLPLFWKAVNSHPKYEYYDTHDAIRILSDRLDFEGNKHPLEEYMFKNLRKINLI